MISALVFVALAHAAEPVYNLEIKNHKMTPEVLNVNAGEEFWIEVKNLDNTSEELESNSLKFERIIGPKKTVKVKIKSLAPGSYDLYGDFHADVCKATMIATPPTSAPAPAKTEAAPKVD